MKRLRSFVTSLFARERTVSEIIALAVLFAMFPWRGCADKMKVSPEDHVAWEAYNATALDSVAVLEARHAAGTLTEEGIGKFRYLMDEIPDARGGGGTYSALSDRFRLIVTDQRYRPAVWHGVYDALISTRGHALPPLWRPTWGGFGRFVFWCWLYGMAVFAVLGPYRLICRQGHSLRDLAREPRSFLFGLLIPVWGLADYPGRNLQLAAELTWSFVRRYGRRPLPGEAAVIWDLLHEKADVDEILERAYGSHRVRASRSRLSLSGVSFAAMLVFRPMTLLSGIGASLVFVPELVHAVEPGKDDGSTRDAKGGEPKTLRVSAYTQVGATADTSGVMLGFRLLRCLATGSNDGFGWIVDAGARPTTDGSGFQLKIWNAAGSTPVWGRGARLKFGVIPTEVYFYEPPPDRSHVITLPFAGLIPPTELPGVNITATRARGSASASVFGRAPDHGVALQGRVTWSPVKSATLAASAYANDHTGSDVRLAEADLTLQGGGTLANLAVVHRRDLDSTGMRAFVRHQWGKIAPLAQVLLLGTMMTNVELTGGVVGHPHDALKVEGNVVWSATDRAPPTFFFRATAFLR